MILKWIIYLNARVKTTEVCFYVWLCIRKDFLDITSKALPIKENINELDH